jgi:hypothetical protein
MLRSWTLALACMLNFALAGCMFLGDSSSGLPSHGLKNTALTASYLPLVTPESIWLKHWGAAVVVAPHIAVTDAHNAVLIPAGDILAQSKDYDLLFFRTDRAEPAPTGQAQTSEAVIAYGQGKDEDLREAAGIVRATNVHVQARCKGCAEQRAVAYDAEGGPGFSGGPLVDANTGAVVGITFGYRDEALNGGRRMFAYGIDLVLVEMHHLLGENAPKS